MKPAKKLELARWAVAGAIFGAAIAGVLSTAGLGIGKLDITYVGALMGAVGTALAVKAAHLV